MKTYNEFLSEKHFSFVTTKRYRFNNTAEMFANPTTSDLIAIYKKKERDRTTSVPIRFIAVAKTKEVIVWEAIEMNHLDGYLGIKEKIPSVTGINNVWQCFTGTANLKEGRLIYSHSDTYDFAMSMIRQQKSYHDEYAPFPTKSQKMMEEFPETLLKMYEFVEDYIDEFTSDQNALVQAEEFKNG